MNMMKGINIITYTNRDKGIYAHFSRQHIQYYCFEPAALYMPLATSMGIVTRFCVQSFVKCVLIRVWSATFSADTNEDPTILPLSPSC